MSQPTTTIIYTLGVDASLAGAGIVLIDDTIISLMDGDLPIRDSACVSLVVHTLQVNRAIVATKRT